MANGLLGMARKCSWSFVFPRLLMSRGDYVVIRVVICVFLAQRVERVVVKFTIKLHNVQWELNDTESSQDVITSKR